MKKIFLNETHIRQLVKETLENLLIDNEVNHNLSSQEVVELINNSELEYDDDLGVDGDCGYLRLTYTNPQYEEFDLEINFQIAGYITPYYQGDYYTPPEGGELEIEEIKPISAYLILTKKIKLNLKELYSFLSNILNSYWNEIYEKVDPEYFIIEPDPDAEYEAWKNGDFD